MPGRSHSSVPWPILALLPLLVGLPGCLSAALIDGQYFCATSTLCPEGFSCSGPPENVCRRGGKLPVPDMVLADLTTPDQLDLLPVDVVDDAGRCVPDPLEPNDIQRDAQPLGPGTNLLFGIPTSSASLCPDEEDWYKVDPISPSLNLLFSAQTFEGVSMDLRNGRGTQLATAAPVPGGLGLRVDDLALGEPYFIRISGAQLARPLAYGLLVTNPANDACEGATEIGPEVAAFFDSFLGAHNDYDPDPSCTGFEERSPDLTYHFRLDQQQRVLLYPDSFGSLISIYLLEGSGADTCDRAAMTCVAGGSGFAELLGAGQDPFIDRVLDPGDYYLVVSILQSQQAQPVVYIQAAYGIECNSPAECGFNYCARGLCRAPRNDSGLVIRVPSPVSPAAPVGVPDGAEAPPLEVPIEVPAGDFGPTDRVGSIHLGLWVRHSYRGDLTVRLTSPPDPDDGGRTRTVTLISRPGVFGERGNDFRNDINELFPLSQTSQESLTVFNGAPIVGTWVLSIEDGQATDTGELIDATLYLSP